MAVTLANLRTESRQAANMEVGEFVEDSELTGYINNGYRRLYHKVAQKFTERLLNTTPTTFSIASGANTASVANDFFRLWGVDLQVSTNKWIPLHSFLPHERNHRGLYFDYFHERVKYRLLGQQIHIVPTDSANGDYRYWYVPTVTILSGDSDEIESEFERTGWYEFIVFYAAWRMLTKEESDTREVKQQMQFIMDAIDEEALNRDLAMPNRIQDVRGVQPHHDLWVGN